MYMHSGIEFIIDSADLHERLRFLSVMNGDMYGLKCEWIKLFSCYTVLFSKLVSIVVMKGGNFTYLRPSNS